MITVVNKSVDYLTEFLSNSENLDDVDCDRLLATLFGVKRGQGWNRLR